MLYDAYVICTSPRSGSTLLCDLLAATGVAGNPDSYFHRPSVAAWAEDLGVAANADAPEREIIAAVFAAAIAAGTRDTGLFALRLQRHSFDLFAEKLAVLHPDRPDDVSRLSAAFGRTLFVHLSRGDKVAQAVSYVKARQTGLWHAAPDGTEIERLSPPRAPVYDRAEIAACLADLTAQDRAWEEWFATNGVAPLRLTYEALSAAPHESVRRVLAHLGADPRAADALVPGVAKLADGVNASWVERFVAPERDGPAG